MSELNKVKSEWLSVYPSMLWHTGVCLMRVPGLKKIDLLHFLAGCHKRQLNQALSVRCLRIGLLSVFFCCLLVGTIVCVALVCVCMCSVSWLFWLSCQYSAHCDCLLFCALEILLLTYLPSDWLERLPWGRLFMVRRLSPQSSGQRAFMIFSLVYCFVILLCVCLVSQPYTIHFILLWLNMPLTIN